MLQLLTHGSEKRPIEWVELEVNGVKFKVSAKLKRKQAYLLIDAPKEVVSVTRENANVKREK